MSPTRFAVECSNAQPSSVCPDRNSRRQVNAVDVDVELDLDGVVTLGEVTLLRSADTWQTQHWVSWGETENWLSGNLCNRVAELPERDRREVLHAIEAAAAKAARGLE